MKFNSLTYLIFLFLSFAIYWAVNKKYRLYFLLFASITFYSYWSWKFLVLICISAFVDYCFSKNIYHAHTISKKTFFLTCAISSNLILLIAFKYLNFFIENLLFIFSKLNISTSLHYVSVTIPLGISFYTFLSISYVTDVYKGITKPAGNYLKYLTYVIYWPHMIAGPILRFSELFPQLYKKSSFRLINIVAGLRLIITGLFLKVVLADQLSYFVDEAFSTPVDLVGGLDVLTMSSGFGLQIYFDFAGYSMIAIGSAKLFGINFVDNFNWPYLSVSPKDFWRRWHITLSSWVRDYLYFPLLGLSSYNNSKGGIGINRALNSSLFFSWIIMGLWHGASWNFAFWGLWHAILISLYRAFPIDSLFKNNVFTYFINWAITFVTISVGWIFFRAKDLQTSILLITKIFKIQGFSNLAFNENFYLFVFILFNGMIASYFFERRLFKFLKSFNTLFLFADSIYLSTMLVSIFIYFSAINQFIYFEF